MAIDTLYINIILFIFSGCVDFPDFPNSVRITQGIVTMLNTTANYTCNIGYEPQFFSVTCIDNLLTNDTLVIWSDPTENCAKGIALD